MITNIKSNAIIEAIAHLKLARELLRIAEADKSRAYVARAIKSAEGAKRNAQRFEFQEAKQ